MQSDTLCHTFCVTACFSSQSQLAEASGQTQLGRVLFLTTSPFHSAEREYAVSSFVACVGFIMLAADCAYLSQQRWREGPNAPIRIHISMFACCRFLYRSRISGCFFFFNPPSVVTGHSGQNTSKTQYSTCLQRIFKDSKCRNGKSEWD